MLPSTLELFPLSSEHRHALSVHLMRLSPDDRYARFGLSLRNEALLQWIARIDWQQQRWWGAWRAGDVGMVGSLQLAPTLDASTWDIGMTVNETARRQGVGTQLLAAAAREMPELQCITGYHGHPALTVMGERLGFETVVEAQIPRVEISLSRRDAYARAAV